MDPRTHLKIKGSLFGIKLGTYVYKSISINKLSGLLIFTQSFSTKCDSIPISYKPFKKIDILRLQSYSYLVI